MRRRGMTIRVAFVPTRLSSQHLEGAYEMVVPVAERLVIEMREQMEIEMREQHQSSRGRKERRAR